MTTTTNKKHSYIAISESDVPSRVRFQVAAEAQGQMIEVAYGDFGRGEKGPGSAYKSVTDRSTNANVTRYYRLEAR